MSTKGKTSQLVRSLRGVGGIPVGVSLIRRKGFWDALEVCETRCHVSKVPLNR
jgi:hypothetical protein